MLKSLNNHIRILAQICKHRITNRGRVLLLRPIPMTITPDCILDVMYCAHDVRNEKCEQLKSKNITDCDIYGVPGISLLNTECQDDNTQLRRRLVLRSSARNCNPRMAVRAC